MGEASLRVYDLIRAGKGPTSNFRSYFLTSVKTVAVDMARTDLRAVPTETEDLEVASDAVQAYDPGGRVDQQLVRTAFRRLPERDQQVLWHTAVEGTSPAVVATTMGMTANGVSVVALRARDTLRSRYLDAHADRAIERAEDEECRWVLSQLGRYVRGKLPVRQRARVEQHLQDCPHAQAVLLELAEVNRGLPALMVPLIFVAGSATAAAWLGAAAVGASSPDAAKPPTSVVLTGNAAGIVAKAAALVAAGALGVGFVAAPPGGLDLFSPNDSQSQSAGSGGSSSGGPGSPGSVPGAGTPGTAGGGGASPTTEAGSAAAPAELPGSTGAFSNGSTGSAQRREGTSTTPATVSTPAVPVPPAPPSTTTSSASATGTTTGGSTSSTSSSSTPRRRPRPPRPPRRRRQPRRVSRRQPWWGLLNLSKAVASKSAMTPEILVADWRRCRFRRGRSRSLDALSWGPRSPANSPSGPDNCVWSRRLGPWAT